MTGDPIGDPVQWKTSSFRWIAEGEYVTLRDGHGNCIAQMGPNTHGMAGSNWTRTVVNDPETGRQVATSLSLADPFSKTARDEVVRHLKELEERPVQQESILTPLKLQVRQHDLRNTEVYEVLEADGTLLATVVPTPDGSLKIVSKFAVGAFEDGAPMPHPVSGQPPIRAFTIKLDKSAASHAGPV